jgi:cytochrome c-type biogenesis protein CcmH/NrfF
MTAARLLGAFVAAALLLISGTASAAAPRTSLADVEDEVMCPICGTLLELSSSPQADRERAFIRRLISAGRNKQQIKDALVAEYGREALAQPEGSGFELSAYLVPVIGFLLAALALAVGVHRWRRGGPAPPGPGRGPGPPSGEDGERLDADLARYDL